MRFFLIFIILLGYHRPGLCKDSLSTGPYTQLAATTKPAVVTISSVDRGGGPWGVGTGFIVDQGGIIATNFHVIGEHREFTIELADGTICEPTEIVAIDRSRDLALVRINKSGLPTLPLGDSSLIEPGQSVFSIGNPLGYGLSVSQGVVSAIRELELGDGRPMVQFAIPIEAGSSGSPVLNLEGEVIAVLTIKSGGAIGFGVPAEAVVQLLEETEPTPIDQWLTIGMLDQEEWLSPLGGNWRQRGGIIKASGMGQGFGGRMVCLSKNLNPTSSFDLMVEVRLEDESGAAGLAFGSDGKDRHYGFYPTNGSLRLTCFNGPKVFDWNIIETKPSPHYIPGNWNLLQIRYEQGGQIHCKVNGHEVIHAIDFTLKDGWIGLCKFREPAAEFRNFQISPRLPPGLIPAEVRQRVYELSETLTLEQTIMPTDVQELADMSPGVRQAMIDRAMELEKTSALLRKSAEKVRVTQIVNELVMLLSEQENENNHDLLRSALLVARLDNPNFHIEHYLKRVDRLAERISQNFPPHATQKEKLEILLEQMFLQHGYHGSTLDFHHRSNSYLNEVIDDREGLPITLSLLLVELGRRTGLPISGLATPGHFLAFYREPGQKIEETILIDAFAGRIISRKQASELTHYDLSDEQFDPATELEMISRILQNLLRSAEWDRDSPASLRYLDALVAINLQDRYHRTFRAMTRYGLGMFEEALSDITFLIEQSPGDPANAPLLEIQRRLRDPH